MVCMHPNRYSISVVAYSISVVACTCSLLSKYVRVVCARVAAGLGYLPTLPSNARERVKRTDWPCISTGLWRAPRIHHACNTARGSTSAGRSPGPGESVSVALLAFVGLLVCWLVGLAGGTAREGAAPRPTSASGHASLPRLVGACPPCCWSFFARAPVFSFTNPQSLLIRPRAPSSYSLSVGLKSLLFHTLFTLAP